MGLLFLSLGALVGLFAWLAANNAVALVVWAPACAIALLFVLLGGHGVFRALRARGRGRGSPP